MAFGQAIHAVVLHDVHHVHVAAYGVDKLADANRRRVAVAGYTEVEQIFVDGIGSRGDRGHASVDGVESMGLTEVIRWRFRGAPDA